MGSAVRSLLLLAGVTIAHVAWPRTSGAQTALTYDKTTFVHGFASTKRMWLDPRPDLLDTNTIGWLRSHEHVDLKLRGTPDLDPAHNNGFGVQLDLLRTFVADSGGTTHLMVGHSMGSLLSRALYVTEPTLRPRVAAIVATTAPHRGADIAIYAPEARRYFQDLGVAMQAALDDLEHYETAIKFLNLITTPFRMVVQAVTGEIRGPEGSFLAWLGTSLFGGNISPDLIDVDQLNSMAMMTAIPSLGDLPPLEYANRTDLPIRDPELDPPLNFEYVGMLDSARADVAVPRANVYAEEVGPDAVPLKLFHTMSDDEWNVGKTKDERRDGRKGLTKCKKLAGFLSMGGVRSRCARAERLLWNMDINWYMYTTGIIKRQQSVSTLYCSLVPSCTNGQITVVEPRGGATDGVVPASRSTFPGLTDPLLNLRVTGRNHMSIYRHEDGVGAMADAMFSVGAVRYTALTGVSLTGPTSLKVGTNGTWTATPSGGASPFRYRWTVDGVVVKDGLSNSLTFEGPNKTNMLISVKVTDEGLASKSASRGVSMTGYTCPNHEIRC